MVNPKGYEWRQREEWNDPYFRASPVTIPSIHAGTISSPWSQRACGSMDSPFHPPETKRWKLRLAKTRLVVPCGALLARCSCSKGQWLLGTSTIQRKASHEGWSIHQHPPHQSWGLWFLSPHHAFRATSTMVIVVGNLDVADVLKAFCTVHSRRVWRDF